MLLRRFVRLLLQVLTSPRLRFPRVYFRMAGTNLDHELGRALENCLRQRFEVTPLRKALTNWVAHLTVGKKRFGVALRRRPDDYYVLQVMDFNGSNFWQWIRGRQAGDNSSELKAICNEIYGLLNATPLVSEVWGWCLQGAHGGHIPPVASPDELPWGELSPPV
jgi:hypothetical protein